MFRPAHIRRAFVIAAAGALTASCKSIDAVSPSSTDASGLFKTYVAMGNSLTAGYQSGGINDSTQRQSFAVLVAKQMHTHFAYPSLNGGDGCRPIVNFQTQALTTNPSPGTPCFRNPIGVSNILNSVAVPGAASIDPTTLSTTNSNGLTALILGGRTQVQAALDAQPTFVSIWIGNNDILPFAVGGIPALATAESTFETNYNAMISQLTAGDPGLKGVLIGVVNVTAAPVLFTSAALQNPAFVGGLSQAAGKAITVGSTCTGTDGSLISMHIVPDIATGVVSTTIQCTGNSPFSQDDILSLTEQAQVTAAVTGYNTYIKAKAATLGWAYYDPNTTLATVKTAGGIPAFPNLASATAPFGTYITLDGIHPSAAAHILIANDLIDVINAKYGSNLTHVQ